MEISLRKGHETNQCLSIAASTCLPFNGLKSVQPYRTCHDHKNPTWCLLYKHLLDGWDLGGCGKKRLPSGRTADPQAAEAEGGFGAGGVPAHAGAAQAGFRDAFASGFYRPGADLPAMRNVVRIVHLGFVVAEVFQGFLQRGLQLGAGGGEERVALGCGKRTRHRRV